MKVSFSYGLSGNNPGLVVDPGQDVVHIRIDPQVGHSEDRLGPQGGAGDYLIAHSELYQGKIKDCGVLALQDVVILDRVSVMRTPAHRMAALDYVVQAAQDSILPLNELAVGRLDGCELPPPVDGVADALHGSLGHAPEINHDLFRRVQSLQLILGYAVKLCVNSPDQRVAVDYQLGEADDWRPGGVEGHGEEDVLPTHTPKARHSIADGESPCVSGVQVAVEIRIGNGQEELLS